MADRKPAYRALTIGGIVAVVVLITAVAGIQLLAGRSSASTGTAKPVTVQTATIGRTNLATTFELDGQLGYGSERTIKAGPDGQVTWLPRSGTTVTRGEPLFRVNDQPVVLFYGQIPLFRRLDSTGLVGRDVKMVANNLRALGYSIGVQPSVGRKIRQSPTVAPVAPTTPESPTATSPTPEPTRSIEVRPEPTRSIEVRPGDGVLTSALQKAINRWQRSIGATPTGILEVGAVVVQPQQLRVSAVTAQLGDPADSPLISATRTTKVVTVSVKATAMESVRSAKKVTVTLPSGDSVSGKVGGISRKVAIPDGQDSEPVSSATITLDHPSAIRRIDSAPVQVQFVAEARKGVLAVPVGALLALSEGGYALQVKDGALVPVTVGLFAKGLVEVSGDGVTEGTTVVTTS